MKNRIRIISAVLLVTSALSLSSFTASAVESEPYGRAIGVSAEGGSAVGERAARAYSRYELSVSRVYNKDTGAYERLSLVHNGRNVSSDARLINGEPYVSVRSFIGEIAPDMRVSYSAAARTLNVRGTGFEMDVIDGGNVIYANGRTLFSITPSAVMSNGSMYAPIGSIAKALGLVSSYDAVGGSVSLSGRVTPILHGSRFYAEDAVYWLSRIISAESRGESLLGQIAVGSVVMNRVAYPSYPSTIWGVIFDKKYGVQFSPIIDGSIYATPAASAVVAAKICLEGFNVNRSALFFLYPRASTSSWIPNNRQYLFSIGKHDFYA